MNETSHFFGDMFKSILREFYFLFQNNDVRKEQFLVCFNT